MTVIHITCDNCGAKYKLPETFTGSQAKCQKCGSVIDVQKQRGQAAAAAPAAAAQPAAAVKPAAAAKPAVDRSKAAAPAERPARAARTGKGDDAPEHGSAAHGSAAHGRAGHHGDAAHGHHGHDGHHHHHHHKKDDNKMLMVVSGVSLVAIAIAVGVYLMNSGDTPKASTTADKTPAAAKPADTPAAKPADTPAAKPADQPADKPADKPVEAPVAKPADASPPPVEVSTTPGTTKRPWEKMVNPPASMADVADPKSYGEVKWPASIDEPTRTEIRGLVEDVKNGGRAGISAKPKLVKHDYAALFGIVEGLRTLDYKSADDSMLAFELNKVLEQITGGLNARFDPVEAGEELVPSKAEWNTRSVKGWLGMLDTFPDAETFRKNRAERLKKQEAK